MNSHNKTQVIKDLKEKSILVTREFNAPLVNVWRAYTESELLDQWWGPAPWRAETKLMNFIVGGFWLYAMVAPDNQKHWGRMNYIAINHLKNFEVEDGFCDEDGNMNPALPVSKGHNVFTETANGTRVAFRMIYPTEADIQKIVEMGFEEGISICLDQLEEMFNTNKI